jgi:hypothetical protein
LLSGFSKPLESFLDTPYKHFMATKALTIFLQSPIRAIFQKKKKKIEKPPGREKE